MNPTEVVSQASAVKSHAKSAPIQVRCFVYSVGDKCYRAECIDLDIVAEGATKKEVRRGLEDAVMGYLSVVCDGESLRDADEKAFRKLILRPSPLSHRLHYYLGKIGQSAIRSRQSDVRTRFFTVPAPCGI